MPRLAVEISQEQQDALNRCFPSWGLRSLVIRNLLDDLITVLQGPKGPIVIAAIIDRQIHLSDLSPRFDPNTDREEQIHGKNS